MAEATLQFQWIVTIKEGLERAFVTGPTSSWRVTCSGIRWRGTGKFAAPDAMVVFGRPKGYRGSYRQWEEAGIGPQVVFEVLSPGNRPSKMIKKFQFYDRTACRSITSTTRTRFSWKAGPVSRANSRISPRWTDGSVPSRTSIRHISG